MKLFRTFIIVKTTVFYRNILALLKINCSLKSLTSVQKLVRKRSVDVLKEKCQKVKVSNDFKKFQKISTNLED